LVIFSLVKFACSLSYFSGGTDFKSFYISSNNKLYYVGLQSFSIDLTGVSLNGNSIIGSSQWIEFNNTHYGLTETFLGGKANDKLYFVTEATSGTSTGIFLDVYDTTLNNWNMSVSFTGKPSEYFLSFRAWTSDGRTGKSYSIQSISNVIDIFDTINLVWTNSSLTPQLYSTYVGSDLYGPPQTLVNGQLLYF
ncbi:8532_t:CDS:1, partial [Cetraspora pellucida]